MPNKLAYIILLVCSWTWSQDKLVEVAPPSHIKTIIFKGPTEDQFPVVKIGETITLEFDDLNASEEDYYYKIRHANYDWTPSRILKSQYLSGTDNQRILDYENSYSTLQSYSNYKLRLPNETTRIRLTGNYLLEIYDSHDDLVFARRFVVYTDRVSIGAQVKRSRDFDYLYTKQSVQFNINTANANLVNPKQEVKVALIQNYDWATILDDVKPQFTLGQQLTYKYDKETSFFGGNEYFYFDTKDLRAPSSAIHKISLEDLYHHYLFTNRIRNQDEYTYNPDINGDFTIRTLQGTDVSREAEYTVVHFSLPYEEFMGMDKVYVHGKFNNYAINEENQLSFNPDTGHMEGQITMKQGFYNYKYAIERENGTIEANRIGGDFHFTENHYLILVYYRDFGQRYDSVIGIGTANSKDISN
jgi:hypothetical protein